MYAVASFLFIWKRDYLLYKNVCPVLQKFDGKPGSFREGEWGTVGFSSGNMRKGPE